MAQGYFDVSDIVEHSVNQSDFMSVEPSLTQSLGKNPDEVSSLKVNLFSPDRSQQIGMISLKHIQCRRRTSFLNLVADSVVQIVPMVGIDFSMSNLTFDERKSIHSNNEDRPNEYRDLLQAVSKAFKLIAPSALFYGFGANSVMKVTEVSDLFAGTGDLLNPIVMIDNLEKEYYAALRRVELNLPVKHSSLIQKALDFAERSLDHFQKDEHQNSLSYFVVYIFTAGIIDDIDACVSQLARALNLPISLCIV